MNVNGSVLRAAIGKEEQGICWLAWTHARPRIMERLSVLFMLEGKLSTWHLFPRWPGLCQVPQLILMCNSGI